MSDFFCPASSYHILAYKHKNKPKKSEKSPKKPTTRKNTPCDFQVTTKPIYLQNFSPRTLLVIAWQQYEWFFLPPPSYPSYSHIKHWQSPKKSEKKSEEAKNSQKHTPWQLSNTKAHLPAKCQPSNSSGYRLATIWLVFLSSPLILSCALI